MKLKPFIIILSMILVSQTVFSFESEEKGPKYNYYAIYGSYTNPIGTYGGMFSESWQDIFQTTGNNLTVTASDLYDKSFSLGLGFGSIRASGWSTYLGFEFSKINVKDYIFVFFYDSTIGFIFLEPGVSISQYDAVFNVNYHVNDILKHNLSPYFGLGFSAGREVATKRRYDPQQKSKYTLSLNFGADYKIIGRGKGENCVVLSMSNSLDFYGSGYKARYLSIGIALKFFSRPSAQQLQAIN